MRFINGPKVELPAYKRSIDSFWEDISAAVGQPFNLGRPSDALNEYFELARRQQAQQVAGTWQPIETFAEAIRQRQREMAQRAYAWNEVDGWHEQQAHATQNINLRELERQMAAQIEAVENERILRYIPNGAIRGDD